MISLRNLSVDLGGRLLFSIESLFLSQGEHYGIVGANGAGKSTFLKVLTGEISPGEGEVIISKNSRVGWLKQDQFLHENHSIFEVVLRGRQKLWNLHEKKEAILAEETISEEEGIKLAHIEEQIAHAGGYSAEAEAEALLEGLGIDASLQKQPLKTLSGGYKLRVLLARALFESPNVLLLDEPTNYLDIVSIGWLENYLKHEFSGLVLFVSHDHAFLNNVSTSILDIDYGEVRLYRGNYERFTRQKKQVEEQILLEREHIEHKITHMQKFIDKFKAKATKAKQCKSREKMIEKLEWPDLKNSSRAYPRFHFRQAHPTQRLVLETKDLSVGITDFLLVGLNLSIERGEKLAITGPNGKGKSTLLRTLLGEVAPLDGSYEWREKVKIAYFSQEHNFLKHDRRTLGVWLEDEARVSKQQVRSALGAVLFTEDDIKKRVSLLSGGESTRLVLAKMMLEEANVLILDEPTNHLDIEAREALAKALKEFPGTVLFVSHDRDFISEVTAEQLNIESCYAI